VVLVDDGDYRLHMAEAIRDAAKAPPKLPWTLSGRGRGYSRVRRKSCRRRSRAIVVYGCLLRRQITRIAARDIVFGM